MLVSIAQFLQAYWLIPILITVISLYCFAWFCRKYWIPAKKLSQKIDTAIANIKSTQSLTQNKYKEQLEQHFRDTPFQHGWDMYKVTLHDERGSIDGEDVLLRSRATASSEYFFNQSLLVDTPLNVEFFKHLPSIITGIGIIGTFVGLIFGLIQFDASGDPANVQNSLGGLLNGVMEAFIGSGVAIAVAMFITWKEKAWLRTCYAKLEDLTTEIDKLFDSDDVGEQYLAEILASSEQSAKQAKDLKDGFVTELKTMLQNLTDAQQQASQELARQLIESQQSNSREMATQIGQSITESLQAPLDKIASSVQQVSGDQGAAVQDLITVILNKFMNQLETTLGSQMTGMSDMMTQSVSAMREMQQGFNQLIADMRNSSEASAQILEQQMLNMLSGIEQKQQEMNNSLNTMLDEVQKSVVKIGETGTDAAQQMGSQVADMLTQLNTKIAGMVEGITQQRMEQDRVIAENQQALHQTTTDLIDGLAEKITQLLQESQIAIQSSRDNIEKLTQVTTHSISGMNDGAEKMRLAAERFTQAGQSLSGITEQSTALLTQVNALSNGLTTTSNQLRTLVSDYQQSRESVQQAISTLEKVIETAQREAGMSSQMLSDTQKMTDSLNQVSQEMQGYLNQVNDVLVKGFVSFGDAVESSLTRALGSFDNTLEQAVKRLAGAIEGLNDVAEELADMAQRHTQR